MAMSLSPGIPPQGPSIFEVVSRRALERPTRALLDREFVQAFNDALGRGESPHDAARDAQPATPAVDVRA
jgi:hypothetical protein